MANSLPVLTVDIDDSKIKRLEEVAKQFSDAFKTMPSGKVASNNKKENAIYTSNTSNGNASKNNLPTSSQKTGKTEVEKFFDNLGKSSKEANKSLKQLNKTLKETVNVAGSLFSTALGWGVKLAAFSIVGAGGIGLAASGAANSLLAPQGRGISVAQQQAVNVALGGRITGINGMLDQLNDARYKVDSPTRRALQSQGIDYHKSAFENLAPYIKSILKISDQHKSAGAQLNALQSMGFDINSQQLNQLLANRNRLPQLFAAMQTNHGVFSGQVSDKTLSGFQDLTANFTKNAYQLSNTFLTTLSHLSPGMQKFSDAITKGLSSFISGPNGKFLFKKIGQGFETLAKWLGSDKFQSDIKNFADSVSDVGKAIYDTVKWIKGIFSSLNDDNADSTIANTINAQTAYHDFLSPEGKAALNRKTPSLATAIYQAESKYRLPAGLMANTAYTESSFDPFSNKDNHKKAKGLFQFIPETAGKYGLKGDDVFDFGKSSDAAGRYFRDLLTQYNGDITKAQVAYGGGRLKGNTINANKEMIDRLLKILPYTNGALEQHPALYSQLMQGREFYKTHSLDTRFILTLEKIPGADENLAMQSQGQIPG